MSGKGGVKGIPAWGLCMGSGEVGVQGGSGSENQRFIYSSFKC